MMCKTSHLYWLAGLFLAALLTAVLLKACSAYQEVGPGGQTIHLGGTPSWGYSFAGPVANSPILLAAVTNQSGLIVVYACDGQQIAEWFVGTVQGQSADISQSDGSHLQITFTAQDAQGTLTLPGGSPLRFKLDLAIKPAGLYRAKDEVNGVVYLAGWVLLADGRQAGIIESETQQRIPAPRLDPTHPTITLPNGSGTLTAHLVTPDGDL